MPDSDAPSSGYRGWIAALLLAPILGCAGNTAPAQFLPQPVESQSQSYGGWIELEVDTGGKRVHRVEGELIAVSGNSVWVLHSGGGAVVPTAQVKKGKLTGYRSGAGSVAAYAALGTASTLSNGVLLIFTAPLWIITGTVAANSESQQAVRKTPPLKWPALSDWARFPQGMPAGVDLGSLTPKPLE